MRDIGLIDQMTDDLECPSGLYPYSIVHIIHTAQKKRSIWVILKLPTAGEYIQCVYTRNVKSHPCLGL